MTCKKQYTRYCETFPCLERENGLDNASSMRAEYNLGNYSILLRSELPDNVARRSWMKHRRVCMHVDSACRDGNGDALSRITRGRLERHSLSGGDVCHASPHGVPEKWLFFSILRWRSYLSWYHRHIKGRWHHFTSENKQFPLYGSVEEAKVYISLASAPSDYLSWP